MPSNEKIRVVDLYLDLKNPRQETTSQEEAIKWLCENESIDKLAEDIVGNGLNPLETIGALQSKNDVRYVLEGNRRICALKLLAEPELSPNPKLTKKFNQLKSAWNEPILEINCICFSSREEADIWLDRLHDGELGGIGRKRWDALQKQRRNAKPEHKRALMVLEYALQNNWVDKDDIQRKLTTASRYLNNEHLRTVIGLGNSLDSLNHTRPLEVFNLTLQQFINALINSAIDGPVSSRANKVKIEDYANDLLLSIQDTTTHEEKPLFSEGLEPELKPIKKSKKGKAIKPPRRPLLRISACKDLEDALDLHGNTKLRTLYYSLCSVDLTNNEHTPLVTVGAWSFVESLCRDNGFEGKDFSGFIASENKNPFKDQQRKSIKTAAQDLTQHGNLTKHDAKYALFSGESIASIMETLTPMLLYLLKR